VSSPITGSPVIREFCLSVIFYELIFWLINQLESISCSAAGHRERCCQGLFAVRDGWHRERCCGRRVFVECDRIPREMAGDFDVDATSGPEVDKAISGA
jgi:hypothetical protein